MSLDDLRSMVFRGYKRKDVSVDWWSGTQTADFDAVLHSRHADRLLGDEDERDTGFRAGDRERDRE